jgi:hypothetical protein
MRYPKFARAPLAIIIGGLIILAVGQRLSELTLTHLLDVVGGLIWLGLVRYVVVGLLAPRWHAQ